VATGTRAEILAACPVNAGHPGGPTLDDAFIYLSERKEEGEEESGAMGASSAASPSSPSQKLFSSSSSSNSEIG